MGIYWTTYFVRTTKPCDQILLSGMNRILEDEDKARGYVRKEDLLRIFASKVKPDDINRNSYIVEYESTTHESGSQPLETARLPVQ